MLWSCKNFNISVSFILKFSLEVIFSSVMSVDFVKMSQSSRKHFLLKLEIEGPVIIEKFEYLGTLARFSFSNFEVLEPLQFLV